MEKTLRGLFYASNKTTLNSIPLGILARFGGPFFVHPANNWYILKAIRG
jgi:hypothetical protein